MPPAKRRIIIIAMLVIHCVASYLFKYVLMLLYNRLLVYNMCLLHYLAERGEFCVMCGVAVLCIDGCVTGRFLE